MLTTTLLILLTVNIGDLYNHPRFDGIRERINTLKNIDYVYYYQQVQDALRNNIDLNSYSDLLNYVKDAAVDRIIPEGVKDVTERVSNEFYQQVRIPSF